jgi:cytidine deaminase
MNNLSYRQLKRIERDLLDEAEKVMENAYNPYSHFYVGAALFTNDGQIISGTNVENAAYGSTICAERAAILRANAMKKRVFSRIAIIARGEDFDTKEVTSPCGSCRQMLFESSQIGTGLEVIMSTTQKDKIIIATIEELLPLGFGPRDFGIDVKKYRN